MRFYGARVYIYGHCADIHTRPSDFVFTRFGVVSFVYSVYTSITVCGIYYTVGRVAVSASLILINEINDII